jgi:murein DD-endopeptidase MepM/ murein hydrolase activator NlpD
MLERRELWHLIPWVLMVACAQNEGFDIQVYDEIINDQEIILYADNHEPFPVSVELNLELDGLQSNHINGDIIVLEPNKQKQVLAHLDPIPGASWSYETSLRVTFGDVLIERYDTNYLYSLPYAPGSQELVSQGYFDARTHADEYALDFNLKEGTPVFATRDGLVIKVVDHNDKSCTDESCIQFNNFITIQHDDGTYADYGHLKQHSAKVLVGDHVTTNTHIADSGSTGWATGPHLHLVIYLPSLDKAKTLPTLFIIGEGKFDYLKAGKIYLRPQPSASQTIY